MQPCRLCGRIIPVPYDPSAIWFCNDCREEWINACRFDKEDLQKAIQSSLDAYRGQDPGCVCIKGGQEALDQRDHEPADAGHEGEKE